MNSSTSQQRPAKEWIRIWNRSSCAEKASTDGSHLQSDKALCLNTTNHPYEIEVKKDGVTATYVGKGNHTHDVGCVQGTDPLPSDTVGYYFEMEVLDCGEKGTMVIGIANNHFSLNRRPGTEPMSYGFFSEDGCVYTGKPRGSRYSSSYGQGDIVGCGVIYETQQMFFTRNGNYLGVAGSISLPGIWFPTFALHSFGETVRVNFGSSPFKFNYKQYIADFFLRRTNRIKAKPLAPTTVTKIITEYLIQSGYAETLNAFLSSLEEDDTGRARQKTETSPANSEKAMPSITSHFNAEMMRDVIMEESPGQRGLRETLEVRGGVRKAIAQGDVKTATTLLSKHFPEMLDASSPVAFWLSAMDFIRLVSKGDIGEAIHIAETTLKKISQNMPSEPFLGQLEEVLGLLAYQIPESSELGYLFTPEFRDCIADHVNQKMLEQGILHPLSVLEKLMRQLLACREIIRGCNDERGERYEIDNMVES